MNKVIEFKTVSPLFEMERDGLRYFTERKIDNKDSRFRALAQWKIGSDWFIKITNPATNEYFVRYIMNVSRIWVFDQRLCDRPLLIQRMRQFNDWIIIEWDFRDASITGG